jgi:hypothetical protein
MRNTYSRGRGSPSLGKALLLFAAFSLPLTACDGLLDVEDVDVTTENSFVDETSIPALRASVIGDFLGAYESQILYTGLLADEWAHSGTFGTRQEVDQRDIDPANGTVEGLFAGLSRARAIADFANQRYEVVDTEGSAVRQRAEARAFSGLAMVFLTEHYCEGTPISRFNAATNDFDYGSPLTRAAVLDSAMARFNAALAVAPAGSDQEYLARVGLGRALLNAGDYQAAAAAVADVPTSFIFRGDHDAQSGQNNPIWSFNISQERWAATDTEGTNGLPYLAEFDPRMLWIRTPSNDVGFDRATPVINALKYPDRPAFTIIADGVEARLIEAEWALADGRTGDFLTILNDLRAQVGDLMPIRNFDYQTQLALTGFSPTLADLTLPATTAEQVDLLFQERAYWLWLTAHRLGDMRRLIRQYGRTQDAVFPVGLYTPNGNAKGGSYGTDVNFPVPVTELNNPELAGLDEATTCLNRDA